MGESPSHQCDCDSDCDSDSDRSRVPPVDTRYSTVDYLVHYSALVHHDHKHRQRRAVMRRPCLPDSNKYQRLRHDSSSGLDCRRSTAKYSAVIPSLPECRVSPCAVPLRHGKKASYQMLTEKALATCSELCLYFGTTIPHVLSWHLAV